MCTIGLFILFWCNPSSQIWVTKILEPKSKVLASLEAKVKETKKKPDVAFAVSAQYKSKSDAGEDGGCQVELGSYATKTSRGKGGCKSRKKGLKRKRKALLPAQPQIQIVEPASIGDVSKVGQPPVGENSSATSESSSYKAGDYNDVRKCFVKQFLEDAKSRGDPATCAVAHTAWNASLKRAQLLADVSVSELKRRRFIPKGTWENPFKATVEASVGASMAG